nr:hypothetical protein [Tanacetum cinerariifolium]
MERAATNASSLEAKHDSGNINRTYSMATLNEPLPPRTGSGSGPSCQVTIMRSVEAQTRFEAASKQSNDPPLSRVHTLKSREDSIKLKELMEFFEGMDKHKEIYVISSHTKKDFANMRRPGQGFSRNVTPLFQTMMVHAQEKVVQIVGVVQIVKTVSIRVNTVMYKLRLLVSDAEMICMRSLRNRYALSFNANWIKICKSQRTHKCPQVMSTAKLPILNANEFNLWEMRMEQYFLMTDYSLWERLARKNELKAHEWRTHTLIWRNKTDLEDQSLDDLFNSLKIYEDEVKSSSFASTSTQNIAFVSFQNIYNTIEQVSVVASVSAASAKILASALPNVDTLSNVVIYSLFASQSNSLQLDNDDLKQIDADDLEETDLK